MAITTLTTLTPKKNICSLFYREVSSPLDGAFGDKTLKGEAVVIDEVLQEGHDGALRGVSSVARSEVFTVCLGHDAVIPFLVVHAAEAGLRQVDGPDAVGTAVGVAVAC